MLIKQVALKFIRFYQTFLSFDSGVLAFLNAGMPVCRHKTSCSEYTYQAIKKNGLKKGVILGARQLLSCTKINICK